MSHDEKPPNNNPRGKNGHDNGRKPPDDLLKHSLIQYAREGLSIKARLERLAIEHDYHIQKSTLKTLNAKFHVPSSRRNPPTLQQATQLIINEVVKDSNRRKGAGSIKTFLATKDIQIPRRIVRKVLLEFYPEDVHARYPGQRQLKRSHLTALGVFADVSADGHDKISSLALRMGSLSFPIYGFRDRWSGAILSMVVVPNNRLATTVGHIYLDLIEQFQAIPLRLTTDKGSETGEMYAMQVSLRRQFAPQLDDSEEPAYVAVRSVHNTTIESVWHWLREHCGKNIVDELRRGLDEGIFQLNSELHTLVSPGTSNLANWIWPPIIQAKLYEFSEYFNQRRVRTQADKRMPSGGTPTDFFVRPQAFGGERLSIPVPTEAIHALRDNLSMLISREKAFDFVENDGFTLQAHEAWETVGGPELTLENGWEVFGKMLPHVL